MKELLKSFWTDESGQGLTEYALIIALVAIGLILVLIGFRGTIANTLRSIGAALEDAPGDQEAW